MPQDMPDAAQLSPGRLFSSLKLKFIGALVLLTGLVLALSTGWNLVAHRRHMLLATRDKVRAEAESIHRGIQIAMRTGRHGEIARLLHDAMLDPDVRRVLVLDAQGTIRSAAPPDLVGRNIGRDRLSRYLDQPDLTVTEFLDAGEPIQSVVTRIPNRPECRPCHGSQPILGALYVDLSFKNTQDQIAEMEHSGLWTMLVATLLLAGGGALLLVRLVDRPVARLIQGIGRVEGGDLDARVAVASSDELGRLTASFNRMVAKLQVARTEIEGYHQERLRRAERLATLGELSAAVAHEIKNPLAGISGAVRVMADDLPITDPRKEIMLEILEQVRRLDKSVQDLLTFAKPSPPEWDRVDLHRTLDRVLMLLAEHPGAKTVKIARRYARDLPPLEGDAAQLGRVFLNLFLNAIQAMGGAGELTIETALHPAAGPAPGAPVAEVAVTDTGPGIPAHALHDVFQPFFTLKHQGTGLGLSISRRIVEDHGGWIAVESPAGRGATFRVFLPIRAPRPFEGAPA